MDKVMAYYNKFDEWGRLDREPLEFLVNWHYMRKYLPQSGHVLDNGAGPGKYAMELARAGYNVTLTDYTPRLVEVAREKAQELDLFDQFQGFAAADARDLGEFPDNEFDSALMLGPLYHLQEEVDRVKAVQELHRVTKQEGIVFVAFMTRIKFLTTSLMFPEHWKPHNHVDNIESFLEKGTFNHADEGRFTGAYYFAIEDIKPFMESCGFETLNLISSSSVAGAMQPEQFDYWRDRGGEEYNRMMELVYKAAADPSILGVGSHLLYIGKRK
ncbi:class I SAM-dependent methyltransferase [Paenibacillus sp. N1-5-1-14]|uniref:class I SAM-dependent methyltransferase n=1 Tax=Paenibacillus radicibacter TaxID=2972488 RepID=UPI002159968F|nr:class I SAM-dependent methyltransferase [Paenibacillus radicibacter]MCR8645020.1 class I SAM-dependent methyltransferase [Paenibacillus radicibacter]